MTCGLYVHKPSGEISYENILITNNTRDYGFSSGFQYLADRDMTLNGFTFSGNTCLDTCLYGTMYLDYDDDTVNQATITI